MSDDVTEGEQRPLPVVVGVDVGGTNTDAVVISKVKGQGVRVLAEDKHLTTSDVTAGVRNAVLSVLRTARKVQGPITVRQVNIGTTHFVNAVVQHKHLSRVAVIRLCGPASRAVPPFFDFPTSLKRLVAGPVFFVKGGYRVDGREIEALDPEELRVAAEKIRAEGVTGIVVCSIFAPTRPDHELQAARILREAYPEVSLTLSHAIGQIGLLERENAAILNECIKELCRRTISGFRRALDDLGVRSPLFLTQNDGTVIGQEQALATPVFTFASGPTNSMRGAAFLCDVADAVVVDIGGTTTDAGVLRRRFPREASTDVRVAGVRTNFRMPDVRSVGLGGGSYVTKTPQGQTQVGPLSAGFNLQREALVFGTPEANADVTSGRWLTATDVAVAAGMMKLGDRSLVRHLPEADVAAALQRVRDIVEEAIDSVRVSDEPLPVILVGGGSLLLDRSRPMQGVQRFLLPDHHGVANAIGAALSQVSGSVDGVTMLEAMVDAAVMERAVSEVKAKLGSEAKQEVMDREVSAARKPFLLEARDAAIRAMEEKAKEAAVRAGADPATLQIVEVEDVALTYLPGSATRIKVKAIGELKEPEGLEEAVAWEEPPGMSFEDADSGAPSLTKQTTSVTGHSLAAESESDAWAAPIDPRVDPNSGEWVLSEWDIDCIAVGAGILGAGGGGNPHVGRVRAREAVRQGQKIRVVAPDRLLRDADPENDLLISLAFMGAPLVLYEQTTSGQETPEALRCLQDLYSVGNYADGKLLNKEGVDIKEKDGVTYIDDYKPRARSDAGTASDIADGGIGNRRVVGILCAEVGGMNSLEPLQVSATLGLPALDADGMGRAFPMLQMFLPFINGCAPYPCALADDKGRRAVILHSQNARQVEDHMRLVSMDMGSAAGLAIAPVSAGDVKKYAVMRSFSRAWKIGDTILRARRQRRNPLLALMEVEPGRILLVGKIRDVTRETSGAFNRGRVRVEGVPFECETEKKEGTALTHLVLDFQNENLVVRQVDEQGEVVQTLAVVPDVISIVDAETAEPIPTEEVRYGQRVAIVIIPAPPPMTTPRALEVVGPAAFGYPEVEYRPLGYYREPTSIPPS